MKRFHFQLESVLQLRARAETDAQLIHAAAGRHMEECMAEFSRAESDWKAAVAELSTLQQSSYNPAARGMLWNAMNYHKDQCKIIAGKVKLASEELEVKRQALLAARRDHEALVKMKEKHRQEYDTLVERDERSRMDDMINARHMANQMSRISQMEGAL